MSQPARLMFNSSRRLSVDEVTGICGIAKKDVYLLKHAVALFDVLKDTQKSPRKAMLVGGVPLRLYTTSDFKGRVGVGRHTDVDLAFAKFPVSLRSKLVSEHLVDRSRLIMPPTMGECIDTEPRIRITNSPYNVFHLQPQLKGTNPVLYDVCFFAGQIGKIRIHNRDINSSNKLIISDEGPGRDVTLALADPGFLLATVINDQAITTIRARRACFTICSQSDSLDDIIRRYADVMKRSEISRSELQRPLNILLMKCANVAREAVEAFVRQVQEKLF